MSHVIDDQDDETYYDRNKRWLIPLLAGLVLVLAPGALRVFAPEVVPTWLPAFAGAVATVALPLSALGAIETDTISARVVLCVLGIGAVLYAARLFLTLLT